MKPLLIDIVFRVLKKPTGWLFCIYLIGKDKKQRRGLQLQFWTKHKVTGNSLAYLCIMLCERAGAVTHCLGAV